MAAVLSKLPVFANYTVERVALTGSTNDDLKENWKLQPVPELVRIADEQCAGRGQHGRRWQSMPGQALLFSFSLTKSPSCFPVSLLAGLALQQSISELVDSEELWLKWPNDLWFKAGKLAGILCEGCCINGQQHWVVGLGVNLLPLSGESLMTVGLAEIASFCDSEDLLCRFFAAWQRLSGLSEIKLAEAWTKAATGFWHKQFEVSTDSEKFVGQPLKLLPNGNLLVNDVRQQKSRQLLSATLKPLF